MAAVEQPVNHLSLRFETMKINTYGDRAKVVVVDGCSGVPIESNVTVATSAAARLPYPSNGLVYPLVNFYDGSQYTSPGTHGYNSYPVDNMHFHDQAVDYAYSDHSLSGGQDANDMQYQSYDNSVNGYMYWPQLYQYPTYQYYQEASPDRSYQAPQQVIPAAGIMMPDLQDHRHVIQNGPVGMSPYTGQIADPPVANATLALAAPYNAPSLRSSSMMHNHVNDGIRSGLPAAIPTQHSLPLNYVQNYRRPASTHSNMVYRSASTTMVDGPCLGATANRSGVNTAKSMEVRPKATDTNAKRHTMSKHRVMQEDINNHSGALSFQARDTSVPRNKSQCDGKSEGDCIDKKVQACSSFASGYTNARFFIIKSYSEDNVYKSIKFNVWASTAGGNRKLDEAYQEAQRGAHDKPYGCPVFLFFSVNGSRQFCGVAEMVGSVDYSKTMPFWEQHKWSGSFPVKWHIIKDLPNSQLRHIVLENNEYKPVTNSRDTQEVKFQLGLEMLGIFRSYPTRTSIMDDYCLHASSPKAGPDVEPSQWCVQHFPKLPESVSKKNTPGEDTGSRPSNAEVNNEVNKWRRLGTVVISDTVVTPSNPNVRLEKEQAPKNSERGENTK